MILMYITLSSWYVKHVLTDWYYYMMSVSHYAVLCSYSGLHVGPTWTWLRSRWGLCDMLMMMDWWSLMSEQRMSSLYFLCIVMWVRRGHSSSELSATVIASKGSCICRLDSRRNRLTCRIFPSTVHTFLRRSQYEPLHSVAPRWCKLFTI